MPENFEMSYRGTERKSESKWKKRAPMIIFAIAFVGVLSGLIAVAVLYSEAKTEIENLQGKVEQGKSTKQTDPTVSSTILPTVPVVSSTILPTIPVASSTILPTIPVVSSTILPTVPVASSTILPTGPTVSPVTQEIWRLNQNVSIQHYKLDLEVHLPFNETEEKFPLAFTTKGIVEISLRPKVPGVKEFQFHARTATNLSSGYLKFDSKDVTLFHNDTQVDNVVVVFQPKQDIVIISTEDALEEANKPDEYNYKIKINFIGTISKDDDNQGLYRSSYAVKVGDKNVKRYAAATQFQPYKARRVFPCFDEPAFRSHFEISVVHDARFTVYSNGKASSDSTYQQPSDVNGTTWIRTKFTTTPKMSSYLVAFLVANSDDFTIQEKEIDYNNTITNNTEQRKFAVIARDSSNITATFALEQGVAMTKYLSGERFGQPLYDHLKKIDMASVPDFNSGAMENWGLILYRESEMLYDEKIDTASDKMGVAQVVAHELSHFLFGNLLTCEFWDDTWLNEGFARFYQYELVHETKPHWKVETLVPYLVTRSAFRLDSYETAHALYNPETKRLDQIDNMFDTTTYAKGGAILQMIRGVMGSDNFDLAIRNYLETNKLGNVQHTKLLSELENVGHDQLNTHLQSWITENGYPVLQLNKAGADFTFKQNRFLFSGNESLEKSWHIPLTVRTKADSADVDISFASKGCWLEMSSGDLRSLCPKTNLPAADYSDWYIANVDQKSYYRVDYDQENWNRIAIALSQDKFGELNTITRGQLLDDAFNLAKTGKFTAKYGAALELTKYLSKETEYTPMTTGLENLKFIEQRLWKLPKDRLKMNDYMSKCVLGDLYKTELWNNAFIDSVTTANYHQVMYQSTVIESACYYGNRDCISDAQKGLKKWQEGNGFNGTHEPGTNNVLSSMLCYGVRIAADDTESAATENWNYLFELLQNKDLETTNKLILLRALSCSPNQDFLTRILELSLDRTVVRAQNVDAVFSYITKFPEGLDLVWNFVQINWDDLTRRSGIIANLASKFSSSQQLTELKRFYTRRNASGSFPEKITFENTIVEVEANVDWVKEHKEKVIEFFNNTITCASAPIVW